MLASRDGPGKLTYDVRLLFHAAGSLHPTTPAADAPCCQEKTRQDSSAACLGRQYGYKTTAILSPVSPSTFDAMFIVPVGFVSRKHRPPLALCDDQPDHASARQGPRVAALCEGLRAEDVRRDRNFRRRHHRGGCPLVRPVLHDRTVGRPAHAGGQAICGAASRRCRTRCGK